MKKIVAFGASNSSKSINKRLAYHVADQVEGVEVIQIDLNDFEMPIYSEDRERAHGVPPEAYTFLSHLDSAEGIIISFAEHNGSYSAAFKNIFDWTSRLKSKLWEDKKMLLLSTSPGGRGAASVLAAAVAKFPFMGAEIVGHYALPLFDQNFDDESGITNDDIKPDIDKLITTFSEAIKG